MATSFLEGVFLWMLGLVIGGLRGWSRVMKRGLIGVELLIGMRMLGVHLVHIVVSRVRVRL